MFSKSFPENAGIPKQGSAKFKKKEKNWGEKPG